MIQPIDSTKDTGLQLVVFWPVRQPAEGMSPYGRPKPANGDNSRKSSSSSRRRSRSLTSNFLFLWVCLVMAFSPPPFLTFSLNSTYLTEWDSWWMPCNYNFIPISDKSRTYFLWQALLFRRLASYTCRWMGWRGCSSTGRALRRALLLLAAELMQRTEHCQRCSASLRHKIHTAHEQCCHRYQTLTVSQRYCGIKCTSLKPVYSDNMIKKMWQSGGKLLCCCDRSYATKLSIDENINSQNAQHVCSISVANTLTFTALTDSICQ